MIKLKPCPNSVKKLGAALVKARRAQGEAADACLEARRILVEEVIPEMTNLGAKEMEAGVAISNLCDAARGEGLVGAAHNSLRSVLQRLGFDEPSDKEILSLLSVIPDASPLRGGGGGKGRR
jgi:hypothetical protein